MQNKLFRKGFVLAIIVLFFGASVTQGIAGNRNNFEKTELNENETKDMKNNDYNDLVKQSFKSGVISNNGWLDQDKLLPSDGVAEDFFGRPVSIDGDTALIGASEDDNGVNIGSVYVFTRSGTVWMQQAKLIASDAPLNSDFGSSVSINGDTALIGARWDDDHGVKTGAAYVFIRLGTVWTQQAKLLASDGEEYDWFGYSVSIDGDTALIGARGDDDHGSASGSAYVFKRSGTSWAEEAKLLASDGEENDWFGYSVSINGDTALIGARWDDDNGRDSGAAYVFIRLGTVWTQQAKLLASDGAEYDSFGISVSIAGDYVIVGAPWDEVIYGWYGSAYVFIRLGTVWTQQAKLLPSEAGGFWFGYSVSINGDIALIGAPEDYENGEETGAAYVFNRSGTNWTLQAKLLASDGAEYDIFGASVSIDGDTALIGASEDDDNGRDSGSAYVFIRSSDTPPNLTVDGLSPIDLNITDTEDHFINKNISNIPYATYTEEDLDGDGELDDRIFIPDAIDGLYTIEIIPEPESDPTDIFSLRASYKDSTYYLAEDVMIRDIPPEGYSLSWPNKPSTPQGEINGQVGKSYTYTSSTSDPDGDQVFYLFDWGDGTDTGWIGKGEASHTWTKKGNYEIKVKAKDIHDFESDWSDPLPVTMPRNKPVYFNLLDWLFERFPNAFPILQYLQELQ